MENTKKIAISAMLIAFDVIFTRVFALNTPLAKLGLGFAAVAVCAMLYGPWWAAGTSALGDLIGSLLFPTGAYFPGFSVTAAMTGVIFGLALYGRRARFADCFFAALANQAIVTLLLNTAMISLVFGPPFMPLLVTRLAQFGVMTAVQTLVIAALVRSDALYGRILALRGG